MGRLTLPVLTAKFCFVGINSKSTVLSIRNCQSQVVGPADWRVLLPQPFRCSFQTREASPQRDGSRSEDGRKPYMGSCKQLLRTEASSARQVIQAQVQQVPRQQRRLNTIISAACLHIQSLPSSLPLHLHIIIITISFLRRAGYSYYILILGISTL